MERDTQIRLIRRLLAASEAPELETVPGTSTLSPTRYLNPEELEVERKVLFRQRPVPLVHVSEVAEPGRFVTVDLAGVPLLIVRDRQGELHVHLNVCRHRGARVVTEPCGSAKALICPYHAWSYELSGRLFHVPRRSAFGANSELDQLTLHTVPFEERHGLLWVQIDGGTLDVADFLGPEMDADLAGFGFDQFRVHRCVQHTRQANWKLVMDAFAEGYHVKSLHRESLSRFFIDASLTDDLTPHVRHVGARKTLFEIATQPESEWDFRAHTTLFYNLFPCTVLVFHPDWITMLSIVPQDVDRVSVTHRALVPNGGDESQRARWDRSFDLIDGQVFQKEDFAIAESIQSTLSAAPDQPIFIGGLEAGMRLFHTARDAALNTLR